MAEPSCPDCGVAMEGGFPLDSADSGTNKQGEWVEGAPEKNFLGMMKLRGRRKIPMYAWRCPRCSLVRLYAPDPRSSSS